MNSLAEDWPDADISYPVPRAPGDTIPLSFEQERFWHLQRCGFGSACIVPFAFEIEGELDISALEASIGAVLGRHESLRTRYVQANSTLSQMIDPKLRFNLEVTDLRSHHPAQASMLADEILEDAASREFDLARDVFRALLIRVSEQTYRLLIALHHGTWDGWSTGILFGELAALYRAHCTGHENSLPPLPLQYPDYATWQRQKLSPRRLKHLMTYWKERLSGVTALRIAPESSPHLLPNLTGSAAPFSVPEDTSRRIVDYARREGVTLYLVLLAAYQCLLAEITGERDIAVVSPFHGRTHPSLLGLIGSFVNKIVVRSSVSLDATFREHLAATRAAFGGAYAHRDLPYEVLLSALESDPFRVAFAFQNFPAGAADLVDLSWKPVPCGKIATQFDLTLNMFPPTPQGRLQGCFIYSAHVLDETTMHQISVRWTHLLEALTTRGERSIRVSIGEASSRGKCLPELFAEQAELRPAAVALTCEGNHCTYYELDRRSTYLANRLRHRGVGPDQLVGLCIERGLNFVVGLLAILKAGGAYLPLDSDYPSERLAYMVTDASPKVVLIQGGDRAPGWIPQDTEVMSIDADYDPSPRGEAPFDRPYGLSPESLAYVIYTSGSTGLPKGVMVSHANVVRLFATTSQLFDCGAHDVWTLFHSFAFDFSVWELWGGLLQGGRVVIVPYLTSRAPRQFYDLVCQERVTILSQTPSAFSQLMRAQPVERSTQHALRGIIFGGERLEPHSLLRWARHNGSVSPRLINMYGITETTVHVTHHLLSEPEIATSGVSPIGRPLPDLQVHLLDAERRPTLAGQPGELYVSGPGVARGYLNRPDLTAERFLPDPCAADGRSRMYKTGDMGVRRPDGTLEYLGRNDHQVKIRGFRIELAEIESHLQRIPTVEQAIAILRHDFAGEPEIAAFVTCKEPQTVATLRRHLQSSLPSYMIPGTFGILAQMPLTAHGKVDRAALAASPSPAEDPHNQADEVGPWHTPDANTPIERVFGAIWSDILRVRPVSIDADFFDLGGNSLIAIAAASLMQEQSGLDLSVMDLHKLRTIRAIVAAVSSRRTWSPLVEFHSDGEGTPIYFIHSARGSASLYSVLAKAFEGVRPFHGIQAYGMLAGQQPLTDVVEIGARYTRAIAANSRSTRLIIGGYCFGAYLANEVTWRLEALGYDVEATVMIDPEDVAALQDNYAVVPESGGRYINDTRFLSWFSLVLDEKNQPLCSPSELESLPESSRISHILFKARQHNPTARSLREIDLLNMIELYFAARLAMHSYRHRTVRSDLIIVRCKRGGMGPSDPGGWHRTTLGNTLVREFGDNHFSMMNSAGQVEIAEIIQRALQEHGAMRSS